MELKNPFGITDKLLGPETARPIYDKCNEMLRTSEFSVRGILKQLNVKLVCTTEGPLDTLECHQQIRGEGFDVNVHAALRPDKFMVLQDVTSLNDWIDKLAQVADTDIKNLSDFLEALNKRHNYFHENGCRLSDYGLEAVYAEDFTRSEVETIFESIRAGKEPSAPELLKFRSAMLYECVLMDAEAGWVMQLHLGAMRNNSTRMFETLGPDTGFDSIGDFPQGCSLAKFLNSLDTNNKLPKTILYNHNPADNELMATMIGNFQDGSVPGKIQYGSGWWFLDQKDGMEKQITALSNLGLLSRFIGMLTDSRSFLSFTRHEYFRRVLCNLLGNDIELGLIPDDFELVGSMVQDICFNNAQAYFPMQVD
jgi:glucuronate isomerase